MKKLCDKCGVTDVMIGGSILIQSMQKTKEGKGIRYKTTYFGEENTSCNPCSKYVEHLLEEGAVECDYNLNKL